MTQHPDTPTSRFTAVRWTFYRRFGLLMRTLLQGDGTTLSLHDVAERTHGRISVKQLAGWLEQGAQAQPDAVACVVLAQALNVDPDFFVSDEAVREYVAAREASARRTAPTLQLRVLSGLPTPDLALAAAN
ncbi:MAG TPA: helix-turn-helix domain-containing protein [Ktedonobacterales bacterium]